MDKLTIQTIKVKFGTSAKKQKTFFEKLQNHKFEGFEEKNFRKCIKWIKLVPIFVKYSVI